MAYSESLAARIRQAFGRTRGLTEKKMFGGVGYLLSGNMCVGVWQASLIVRLDPDDAQRLLAEPHVRLFDITGRPMKGWLLIEADGLENDEQLQSWVARSKEFVRTLPAK
jgi:TfoX/Sxy family transcriptional regulator of competence genes